MLLLPNTFIGMRFFSDRNLLCVYSKKHMNDAPELAEEKRRANTRTLKEMALLLRYVCAFCTTSISALYTNG